MTFITNWARKVLRGKSVSTADHVAALAIMQAAHPAELNQIIARRIRRKNPKEASE